MQRSECEAASTLELSLLGSRAKYYFLRKDSDESARLQ